MSTNHEKYLSYKEAWRRVNAAIEAGFHFEAVTICESIISDRLLSYISGASPRTKLKPHDGFKKLIDNWQKIASQPITFKDS